MDKLSYAIGLGIGQNLFGMGAKDISIEKFTKAITDVLEGKETEITHEEAQSIMKNYFEKLEAKMADESIQVQKEFLETNGKKEGVITLDSGLQYEVIATGEGKTPVETDQVKCHYEGKLLNNQIFDSSIKRGEPAEFGVTQVIPGWVEALQLMTVGSKWRLYVPYEMAYGPQGIPNAIPPYSTLIFEVELLEIL